VCDISLILTQQWWANFISQSYIKNSSLLFSNPESHGPNPNPNSEIVSPKFQSQNSKSQIPIFPQIHKHELRSVQQRRQLGICQCHCQCYSIACLKCLSDCYSLKTAVNIENDWWVTISNDSAVEPHDPNRIAKKYQIESNPNRRLPNRFFKLSNHSPKVFKIAI